MSEVLKKLVKREYDSSEFNVTIEDLSSDISSFDSIEQRVLGSSDDSPDDLTVAVATTGVTDGKTLNFDCSGGTGGTSYFLALRYTTGKSPQREAPIQMDVI